MPPRCGCTPKYAEGFVFANNRIQIWDMETKKLKAIGVGHQQEICQIDISSDGMHLASVSIDMTLRVWDMHGNEVGRYMAEEGLTSVAFFPENHHLAVGSLDSSVSIVNWRDGSLVSVLRGHLDACYGVDVLPMSRKIVSASLDKSVIVWSKQRPVEAFSPQTELGYSIEKTLMGHEVCTKACLVLHAKYVRIMSFVPRGQTTKGG